MPTYNITIEQDKLELILKLLKDQEAKSWENRNDNQLWETHQITVDTINTIEDQMTAVTDSMCQQPYGRMCGADGHCNGSCFLHSYSEDFLQ